MKNILLCGFVLFLFGQLFAQQITDLEQKISTQKGIEFAETAITLSDLYFQQNNFSKSKEYAAAAFDEAQKKGDKKWMSIALNREAKAMIRLPNRVKINRSRAKKKIKLSNRLIRDKTLKKSNLAILEEVEEMRLKDKNSGGILQNKKNEQKAKIADLKEVKNDLSESVESLEEQQKALQEQQEKLAQFVEEKQAMLREMNEEQMRTEFMLMEQKRLADSMAYVNEKVLMEEREKEMMEDLKIAELQAELDIQKSQQNFLLALIGLALVIGLGLFLRFMGIKKHNKELEEKNTLIEHERQRNEELLLNILPKSVADELKEKGIANAQRFNEATVLFTDFKDFTSISKQMSPEKLVQELDYCFKAFDKIIDKYHLEKIKTIGDSYMCAGGLPIGNLSKPSDMIHAALEIQQFLEQLKKERIAKNEPFFEARIGIHTGPIVAGVVGEKKFAYDIWGSTVNVASRMETNGEAGKVNISAATHERVKKDFKFEPRGKLMAKNYGEVEMFFVTA